MRFSLAALISVLFVSAPSHAAIVLDQEALISAADDSLIIAPLGFLSIPPDFPDRVTFNAVQTFTAGKEGFLNKLQFQLATLELGQGLLTMSLVDGDYAAGARTVVISQTVDFSQIPSFYQGLNQTPNVDFSVMPAGYHVSPGERFSVTFDTILPDPGVQNFIALSVGSFSDQPDGTRSYSGPGYAGGTFLGYGDNRIYSNVGDFDVGFRSYVDTGTAVPEPAAWAMLICGFGVVGSTLRRRELRQPTKANGRL